MRMHQHAYKIWLLSLVQKKGSLAAAASEARLSSSAVSQALTQLEETLSIPLLVRSKRGIALTTESEALLVHFEPAMALFDSFEASVLVPSNVPKKIRIGAYESIGIDLLPKFIPLLRTRWPEMNVEIEIARSRSLLEKCKDAELDLVFVADATHGPSLYVQSYASDTYGIFASQTLKNFGKASAIVETFGLGALVADDKHHTRSFKRFMKGLPAHFRPTLETESFEVILALVRGGAMAGALPLRVAKRAQSELFRLDSIDSNSDSISDSNSDLNRNSQSGLHDLSLACHASFSKSMFDSLLQVARSLSLLS